MDGSARADVPSGEVRSSRTAGWHKIMRKRSAGFNKLFTRANKHSILKHRKRSPNHRAPYMKRVGWLLAEEILAAVCNYVENTEEDAAVNWSEDRMGIVAAAATGLFDTLDRYARKQVPASWGGFT